MKAEPKTDSLTKGDLDKIANLLNNQFDKRFKPFVEEKVEDLETGLKSYIHEGVETIMAGIDNLSEQMAEKEKVEHLVKWAREASKKIGLAIDI